MPRSAAAAPQPTAYEQSRKERILMLQQQMSGVLEASKELRTTVQKQKATTARRQRKPAQKLTMPSKDLSSRRSGRLAGQEAVTYNEALLVAVDGGVLDSSTCVRATAAPLSGKWGNSSQKPEVYNDGHVRALGSATQEWKLFVDGFCPNTGKRVYDKVDGVTCHQCRQKTLGKRTSCSECQSLFGNFCGDCLYMRYGENIDEVAANPAWTCPCCRDICNCSFHRSRAGWAPTGTMYRRALAEGYLSVAHCLILNQLEPETLKKIASGELSVPGGYPEGWAQEHGVPFTATAAVIPSVASNPNGAAPAVPDASVREHDAQTSSQSSRSACDLDDYDTMAAAPVDTTTSTAIKGKSGKPDASLSGNSEDKQLTAPKSARSSATGALTVSIPVKKQTRSRTRRSLGGKAILQPELPPAAGGAVAVAWRTARK